MNLPISTSLRLPSLAASGCGLLAAAAFPACSDDDASEPAPPPPAIAFGAMQSLTEDSGRGGFRFGASSAATQIEDDNPNTDWYAFTAPESEGGLSQGTFVGDASKGFELALDDVALIAEMNLDSYRFSIEWARIEPERDVIDESALAHYDAVIDALLAAGIRPMITVHHFSNPVWIDDPRDPDCTAGPTDTNLCGLGHPMGGPLVIAEMEQHAALLAERYGDRVDEWGTLNEPVNYLLASHGVGFFPPGKNKLFDLLDEFMPVVRDYLHAHGLMYAAIKTGDGIDADGDGRAADVGLTLSVADWLPARKNQISEDPADVAARDRVLYVYHYLVVDSIRAGQFDSDLDGTFDEPFEEIADTLDWLGVQYYFRAGVTAESPLIPVLELTPCFGGFDFGACLEPDDPTFCVPSMGYEFYPEGIYNVLTDMGTRYPDLPLVLTEAGIATEVGERRAENIVRTLEQVDAAIQEGIDVRGYYHWSLIDNFEWAEGFEPRFGLYHVDYDTYARTPTLGAEVLGAIADAREMSSEQRQTHGGTGPMTPEDPEDLPEKCNEF